MATKLEKNVRKIIAHHGGTVVQRGVTGGNWSNCDGLVEGRLICDKYERNNLAMWIKHHPDAELVESTFGSFLPVERLLHRHRGGVRGMRAPPCEAGMVCGHQD